MEQIDKIIADLGANYRKEDKDVLEEILEEVNSIAFNISNNKNKDQLFPYVKRAVKSIYLNRGSEGLQSLSESGISSSFEDIIEKLRNDIIKNGLRRLK
ncbi:MAG: hypothetical protein HFJ60_09005 [Clostridia bacterium]|jgi:hypothetical protein|nr:hypothetical protein [Clostridia bacterium]